jgi:hypothetical protein
MTRNFDTLDTLLDEVLGPVQDEFTNLPCHCGATAAAGLTNLADICVRCLELWLDAGEPELCPCKEVAA